MGRCSGSARGRGRKKNARPNINKENCPPQASEDYISDGNGSLASQNVADAAAPHVRRSARQIQATARIDPRKPSHSLPSVYIQLTYNDQALLRTCVRGKYGCHESLQLASSAAIMTATLVPRIYSNRVDWMGPMVSILSLPSTQDLDEAHKIRSGSRERRRRQVAAKAQIPIPW